MSHAKGGSGIFASKLEDRSPAGLLMHFQLFCDINSLVAVTIQHSASVPALGEHPPLGEHPLPTLGDHAGRPLNVRQPQLESSTSSNVMKCPFLNAFAVAVVPFYVDHVVMPKTWHIQCCSKLANAAIVVPRIPVGAALHTHSRLSVTKDQIWR